MVHILVLKNRDGARDVSYSFKKNITEVGH